MSPVATLPQVEMLEKRFGYFPKTFRTGGRTYTVTHVERCWTVPGRATRLYFRVRCAEGNFVLWQDVNANTWHVEA